MKKHALLVAAVLCLASPLRAGEAKKAVVFVAPPAKDQQWLSPSYFARRQDDEKRYLEGQGYQVEVASVSRQAVLEALWGGAQALSYIGRGGAGSTFAELSAPAWKSAAEAFFQTKLSKTMPAEQARKQAREKAKNLGLELVRNFACDGQKDRALAELFVKSGGRYFGAAGPLTRSPLYEKLAGFVRGCDLGGECSCDAMGGYSSTDLTDYDLPKPAEPGAISGTWYIDPEGTFEISQQGETLTWVLSVPARGVRHEGQGSYSEAIMDGTFADVQSPGGLHAGQYKGWQMTSEGKLCGRVIWWDKNDPTKGKGGGFDCYSRVPPAKK